MYQIHYSVPLSYDLTTFYILGQMSNFSLVFFRKFKISKRHSESNWPLRDPLVSRKLLNFRRLATSVMFSISGSASETIIKDLLFPFPYLASVSSEKTSAMSASNCSSALLINRFWRVLLASLIRVLSNVLSMTSWKEKKTIIRLLFYSLDTLKPNT